MNRTSSLPRILVLTSTLPRWEGDTEPPFVLELSRRLIKNFRIHILAPHAPGIPTEEIIDGIRITRYRYFFSHLERLAYQGGILSNLKQNRLRYALIPFFIIAQVLAIQKLLRRFSFDLIHAHWLIPQGACAILAQCFSSNSPPLLCTSHGGDLYGLSGKPMVWLKRRILNKAQAVTVVSRKMRDDVVSMMIDTKKIQVIPMGIDLQTRFVPPTHFNETKSLLFVGRLVEKKGLRYLIKAMPKIIKQHPNAMLCIVGDGPELKRLKNLACGLGVSDSIQFLGAVSNEVLPKYYQTADIVVFPSIIDEGGDREGFGLVLVEALGCACAVVATNLPSTRDITQDGKNALIVQQKNPLQIADKVIQLLNDKKMRKLIGTQGRQFVQSHFDWDIIALQYASLIHTTIG